MRKTTSLTICVGLVVSLLVSLNQTSSAQTTGVTAKLLHTVPDTYLYWWSPDNKTLAVWRKDVALYDAATGKARAEIRYEGPPTADGIYFTPDGGALVIHSDRVRLYDATEGKLLRQFAEGTKPINSYDKIYKPVETSSYNSETGQTETGWEQPGNQAKLQELPTENLSGRIISPDGKSLLVRAKEGKAQVYNLDTGELKFTLEPFIEPGKKKGGAGDALGEFSADGRFIVTSHRNRTPRLWNAKTGALVADLAPQSDVVYGVRFSPDSRYVATTSFDDGVVKIWESATGKPLHSVGSKKDRNYFAAWNPQSSTFVTKSHKWDVNIWSAETGRLVSKLDGKATKEKFDENLTFVYSPDGKILLTKARNVLTLLSALGIKDKPKMIAHLWDAETGALLASLRDDKGRSADNYWSDRFFWSPSGEHLVSTGVTVKVWNRRGEFVREIEGNGMLRASLSPDGKLLALTGEKPGSWGSTIVDVAKIMVGKLPKFTPAKTHVWQIEGN